MSYNLDTQDHFFEWNISNPILAIIFDDSEPSDLWTSELTGKATQFLNRYVTFLFTHVEIVHALTYQGWIIPAIIVDVIFPTTN